MSVNNSIVNTEKGESPSVDELLDCVDLTFDNYEPSDDALHFWSVMQLIKGDEFFSLGIPKLHYYFIDMAFGNVKRDHFPYSKEINKRIKIRKNKLAILCGRGMALSLDSDVHTPNGIVSMGDIQIGDEVYDRDGKVCNVINKSEIFHKQMYKMILDNDTEIKMCEDHLNIVVDNSGSEKVIDTKELVKDYEGLNVFVNSLGTTIIVGIKNIVQIPIEPSQCITVDSPTESFLTNGYTVTHNSKSTVFSAFLVIYMAMFGRLPGLKRVGTGDKVWFVIGIGDSQENGAKVMCNTIRDMIEESDLLQSYFEKIRCTDAEIELIRANDENNPTSKSERSFLFRTKGSQSGIRGQRYRGERVDVIIGDDLISTEADARSEVIRKSIRGTIYSDAASALRFSGGMQILIGTPFNKDDIIYSAIEKGWTPLVVPVCEKIYEGMPKKEWVGAWPEAHTYEAVMDTYIGMKESDALREFNQERMLRIASEDDKMIKDNYIQWFSRKSFLKNLGDYNLYITTDFTASNDTSKGDYSVVMLWAISSADEWFMIDLSIKRMNIEEQYDPLFRMVQMYGVIAGRNITVGIETNGQQQIHIPALRTKMRELNIHFTFARQVGKKWDSIGISRSGMKKFEHFEMIVPQFQSQKIFFPEEVKDTPDMKLLLEELKYVTYDGFTARHDDGCDGISMLKLIDYRVPNIGGSRKEQKKIYDQLVEDPMFIDNDYNDIPSNAGY